MSKKVIENVNDRGYIFLGKHDECIDFKPFKTFDVKTNEENKSTDFIFHADESGKNPVKEMTIKGYLQVKKIYGGNILLCADFRSESKIHLYIPSREEVDEYNKKKAEAKEKKASAKKAEKKSSGEKGETTTSVIDELISKGIVTKNEKGRYEYITPNTVNVGDKITCLRKNGTFIVKTISAKAIEALDSNEATHFLGLREVAKA